MLNHLEYSLQLSAHRTVGSMKVCLELEHLVDNRIYCCIDVLNHVGITVDRCTTDKNTMSRGYPVKILDERKVLLSVFVLDARVRR